MGRPHADPAGPVSSALRRVAVEARKVMTTPEGVTGGRRARAIAINAMADVYGLLELVPVFSFLGRYPATTYVYDISPALSRGDQPDVEKLRVLHEEGFGAVINLCAEHADGDRPTILAAGLSNEMVHFHHPLTDGHPPLMSQLVSALDRMVTLESLGVRTHVNCRSGRLRGGVVTAGYRLGVAGWSVEDTLTEARNFGNFVPMQLAFIERLGGLLTERYDARQRGDDVHAELGQYPLRRPGSVAATPEQLTATRKSAARVYVNVAQRGSRAPRPAPGVSAVTAPKRDLAV